MDTIANAKVTHYYKYLNMDYSDAYISNAVIYKKAHHMVNLFVYHIYALIRIFILTCKIKSFTQN